MTSVAVAPVEAEAVLEPPAWDEESHTREFGFEGKFLTGKVIVSPTAMKSAKNCQYGEGMLWKYEDAVERCLQHYGAGGITKTEEDDLSRKDPKAHVTTLYRVWTGTEVNDSSSGQVSWQGTDALFSPQEASCWGHVSWLKSDLEKVANAQAAYDAQRQAQAEAAAAPAAAAAAAAAAEEERKAEESYQQFKIEQQEMIERQKAKEEKYQVEHAEEIRAAREKKESDEEDARVERVRLAYEENEKALDREQRHRLAAEREAAQADQAAWDAEREAAAAEKRALPDFSSCGLHFGPGGLPEGLLYGCTEHRLDIVQDALANDADVNKISEGVGFLPLQQICHFWDRGDAGLAFEDPRSCIAGPEILEILMEYGADVNSRDGGGRTPLWTAIYYGHWELATTLITEYDADVNLCAPDDDRDCWLLYRDALLTDSLLACLRNKILLSK